MKKVISSKHPLLQHSLTFLRDKHTKTEDFRRHSAIVSQIMVMEATKEMELLEKSIATPLTKTKGTVVKESLVFLPVLRAGISMLISAQEFLPWVPVGFIGLERDEKTAVAREYYQKFPVELQGKDILVLDPMLATGGSITDTISALEKKEARSISIVCVVAAPEGIKKLHNNHPHITVYAGAVDSYLNEMKYIVPGLGDYGDRYFGT